MNEEVDYKRILELLEIIKLTDDWNSLRAITDFAMEELLTINNRIKRMGREEFGMD